VQSPKPPVVVLERALTHFRGQLTVADASAKSGLSLGDAEDAIRALTSAYGGHLAATQNGDIIYSFPNGLVKPKETRLARRIGRAVAKVALGGVRLVVRAWVSVVLVGYALVFLAILLALTLRGGDDRDGGVGDGVATVMRVIAEALFWTFHPFSPVFMGSEPRWMHAQARRHKLPFYERVNRFVFGPPPVVADPREQERNILVEIRRQKGRIAPGDIARITGLSRDDAERLLLRLVVDYQGDITVAENGAILYTFVGMRATASGAARRDVAPLPVWNERVELAPLTGNSAGSNALFVLINGFNLIASGLVLANGLTLERLAATIARIAERDPAELALMPLPPIDGIPLVLGAIPFAFSLALFALPLVRLLRRPGYVRRVTVENGWRAVLRQVLATQRAGRGIEYTPDELGQAWKAATGKAPSEAELRDAVQRLGGEVDLRADGALVYRFEVISREVEALLNERERAAPEEALPGKVVFSSADEGAGIREDDERVQPAGQDRTTAESPSSTPPTTKKDEDSGPGDPEGTRPPVRLLEEPREPLRFIDRLLAETSRRRK
jgi:hypothetical protein